MLTMLNAKNQPSAIKGMRKKVNLDGLPLPSDVPNTKTKALEKVMLDLALKHAPIQEYFCKDIGVQLQMIESNINIHILKQFTEMELPLPLPEYDSFIVAEDKENYLKLAMGKAYSTILKELTSGGEWSIGIDKKY